MEFRVKIAKCSNETVGFQGREERQEAGAGERKVKCNVLHTSIVLALSRYSEQRWHRESIQAQGPTLTTGP